MNLFRVHSIVKTRLTGQLLCSLHKGVKSIGSTEGYTVVPRRNLHHTIN